MPVTRPSADRPEAGPRRGLLDPEPGLPTGAARPEAAPFGRELADERPLLARRTAQGLLLVGLVLVTASMALYFSGKVGDESGDGSNRVDASDGPAASASLLASGSSLEADGTLADSGDLDRAASAPLVSVAPNESGSDTDRSTTSTTAATTTTWVEPSLPPESEWVDSGNGVLVPDVLLRIRFCESTNNYRSANSSSSARGAYQFLTSSWEWYGHAERTGVATADQATPAQQDEAALRTLRSEGTSPWSESRPWWADPNNSPNYATAGPPTTAAPTSTTETTMGNDSTTSSTDSETTTSTTSASSTETTSTTTGETSTTSDDSATTTTTGD